MHTQSDKTTAGHISDGKKEEQKWKALEERVRLISACSWASPATSEIINGVQIDCVVRPELDRWTLVEITRQSDLDKLRADLAKFASVRPFLFSQNIYAECFFVCKDEPPPSLVTTGNGSAVKVMSVAGYERLFLDYSAYQYLRSQRKFGSAVDPESGESDPRSYVPVQYVSVSDGTTYSMPQLSQLLAKGKTVLLLGNYGTGKSRCVRELFAMLSDPEVTPSGVYPLAIDLRDQWGMKRGREIIQRHCDDLGLSNITSPLMRILDKDIVCLLLDGFDEIGSQTWSENPIRLSQIRSESLSGVKDLLSQHKGGVLITGREHYFNSNEEMFSCLGLQDDDVLLLRCADEFSDSQMKAYLSSNGRNVALPAWVPKRPLVCQLVARMDSSELNALTSSQTGEAAFWQVFVTALCEREKRIHNALDALTIRRLLRRLARVTRDKAGDVGPISLEEISGAFVAVTGVHPAAESALMVQRLSSLGRVASESADRCFVDQYILDGLRAEDVITVEEQEVPFMINVKWKNPLRRLGLTLLAADMQTVAHGTNYHRLMKAASLRQNAVLAGDVVAGMLINADSEMEFEGVTIVETHISHLDMSGKRVSGLSLISSVIDTLDITDCRVVDVEVRDSIVQQILGVTAAGGLPQWIIKCDVEAYESVSTVARIKRAELTEEQRIFVTIIKKLFFQPGAGRQEDALLRGLGSAGQKKCADRIIGRLLTQQIIDRFPGKQGWVYTPIRKHSSRMGRIMMELTLSDDLLWKELRKH